MGCNQKNFLKTDIFIKKVFDARLSPCSICVLFLPACRRKPNLGEVRDENERTKLEAARQEQAKARGRRREEDGEESKDSMIRGGGEEWPKAGQPANSAAPSPLSPASSAATSSELSSAVRPHGGGGPGQGDREEQGEGQQG